MSDMVMSWLYTMLYSGCICGLILYVCPGGKARELMETGAACVMLLAFLSPIVQWSGDCEALFEALVAEQQFQELQILKSAEMLQETLIIEEYETYIFSEAAAQGIELDDVRVVTEPDEGGFPLPKEIRYAGVETVPQPFLEQMEAQLGVAVERQMIYEDTMEAMAE